MNKGLEIINLYENSNYLNTFHSNFMKDLQIVKKELQRLEAIDNANPSEALEKLEMLSDCAVAMKEAPSSNWIEYAETEAELDLKLHFAYLDIKQALLKAQEQEKVLEIIKEKNVNIGLVKVLGNVEQYNQTYVYDNMRNVKWCLTQEEFDLLKRYFK